MFEKIVPNAIIFLDKILNRWYLMRVKLIFLLDVLATSILAVYSFFLHDEKVAFLAGLSVFIALSPICLFFSKFLVLQFAKSSLSNSSVKVNNKDAI